MLNFFRKTMPQSSRSLQTKFQIGLAIILCFFCLLSVVVVYTLQRNLLEREALRQTNLVMSSLEATRRYVRETLRPRMYEVLPDHSFVLESMSSSYITRVIMQNLGEELSEFSYRRVAENPRNPNFAPQDLEQKMITYFRENKNHDTWEGVIGQGADQQFIRFQPVRFTDSCMICHGRPEEAPQGIIDRYGNKGGFNKQVGEVGGLVSVSIPLGRDLVGIRTTVFGLFGGILASGFLLFLFIRLFFRQLVVVNLHTLLGFFRETVTDAKGSQLYEQMTSQDEIREMSEGMRLLASHIRDTKNELEQHALQLEDIVAVRTEALERSHDQLRTRMRQRNRELHLFTTIAELTAAAEPLPDMLNSILQHTLQVIPSGGGAIYLNDQGLFRLSCIKNIEEPQHLFGLVTQKLGRIEEQNPLQNCNSVTFIDDMQQIAMIPLCSRDKLLGLFLITELAPEVFDEPLRDLLVSIGNQIGIAVENVQTTSALRRSEQLLQSVFTGISDPLLLLDSQHNIQMVNEAFLAQNNLQREQVIGCNVKNLPAENSSFLRNVVLPTKPGNAHLQSETIRDEHGNFFEVLLYPVAETGEAISSVICFTRNVTEVKHVEQNMRQTEKLAAVGQLAAGVAHELNNPLWVVLCHTDLIKKENSDQTELIKDIEVIERHTTHCQKIIADLLDFTRKKEEISRKQLVNINDHVHRVVEMVEAQFAKKTITIDTTLDKQNPEWYIDSDRLHQVLLNLVMNASQAIESEGKIHIRTEHRDDHLLIAVEDNGSGIAPEIQDKIFDPFFTTKELGTGTGLGLSVSYGIIKDHGGNIEVESSPGRTVLTIILPGVGQHENQ